MRRKQEQIKVKLLTEHTHKRVMKKAGEEITVSQADYEFLMLREVATSSQPTSVKVATKELD